MIRKRILISTLLLLSLGFVLSVGNNEDMEKRLSGTWINIDYIECMKNKLPCECEEEINGWVYLWFDRVESNGYYRVEVMKSMGLETLIYDFKEVDNKYEILSFYHKPFNDSPLIIGEAEFRDSSIVITDTNQTVSVFRKVDQSNGKDKYQVLQDNLTLLNMSFKLRGYPDLGEILYSDSLKCNCAKWYESRNAVYNGNKSWDFRIFNDSLYIYEIRDTSDTAPPKFCREFFKIFKWEKID